MRLRRFWTCLVSRACVCRFRARLGKVRTLSLPPPLSLSLSPFELISALVATSLHTTVTPHWTGGWFRGELRDLSLIWIEWWLPPWGLHYRGSVSENFLPHGQGAASFFNADGSLREVYEGNYIEGKKHGKGEEKQYEHGVLVSHRTGLWTNDVLTEPESVELTQQQSPISPTLTTWIDDILGDSAASVASPPNSLLQEM